MRATMIAKAFDAITCRGLGRPAPAEPRQALQLHAGAGRRHARAEHANSSGRHPAVRLSRKRMSADTVVSKVPDTVASKVPAVTLGFWIIEIAATTLGETGGDTLSMTFNLGYLLSTLIFATALVVLVACQIAAKKFHPALYWATIIVSTTGGRVGLLRPSWPQALRARRCASSKIAPGDFVEPGGSVHTPSTRI